jgi:hypothetical protein
MVFDRGAAGNGAFQFLPVNAFDHLDPGEEETVRIDYRRSGDAADRFVEVRVTGPEGLGPDLLRGVRPEDGVYAFSTPVPANAVVDIAYTIQDRTTGGVTPSVSGVPGRTQGENLRHSDSFRAGPGGAAHVAFTPWGGFDGTVSAVRARVVLAAGEAAPITYLRTFRPTAQTLTIDFGVATAVPPPDFPPAVDVPGRDDDWRWRFDSLAEAPHATEHAPAVFANPPPYTDPAFDGDWGSFRRTVTKADTGRLAAYRARHVILKGYNAAFSSIGYRQVWLEDVQFQSIMPDGMSPTPATRFANVWRGGAAGDRSLRLGPDPLFFVNGLRLQNQYGDSSYLDTLVSGGWYGASTQDQEGFSIDYSMRFDTVGRLMFNNFWMRWSPDALIDGKAPYEAWFLSVGELVRRPIRSWSGVALVAHLRHDVDPVHTDDPAKGIVALAGRHGWTGYANGAVLYWRRGMQDGSVPSAVSPEAIQGTWAERAYLNVAGAKPPPEDKRGVQVLHIRPRRPAWPINATDFEVEGSADGGSTWVPLAVGMGPNDAIGALYRRDMPAPPDIGQVRVRARWGAKTGAWRVSGIAGAPPPP